MRIVIIFGAPGSGKGTQSELLISHYGYNHISTGDLLRAEIAQNTELGQIAKTYIDQGQLVPDSTIIGMIEHVLEAHKDAKGIIFDGFPRTVAQADALCDLLGKHGTQVDLMIELEVPEKVLIERILERGKASGRSDDNLDTVNKRLSVYYDQTASIADYYKKKGKHRSVDGVGTIEQIAERIRKEIDQLNSN
ncbi:adenylate kinase [Porphyromonas crevioricanis]|uniref:Adenylate kinase n=2 Tax=Porphyromonas crevioricanis TaxID=393921 RepID=A0A0A2G3A1_9PORP|nr:adenylate kinase [Porphyromonas crevioricanis]KGN90448.1 adenylate kinase [Porphyromonas crevioricanis]KGN96902.1 adenylate kinase [Porphyromonas crevioricanis]SJZ91883.1 adenylate kinase [Porphyromonas crevioricanis]SQH73801.1 Adenylate kinase [Porphyromonas crevioricanis]GAD05968.1 adenylate kinase [Porphyromonas crevioricanis JCM 15906]